jgi:glutamate synthase domain-containing protein 3
VGVATQDEALCRRFKGKPEYIENYFRFVAQELREIMASLGIKRVDEMIGRTELLEINKEILNWKTKEIDLSRILYKPKIAAAVGVCYRVKQAHAIDDVLDRKLIEMAEEALKHGKPVRIELPIYNTNRATGALLSGEVCKLFGEDGLPEDTICCKFKGVAGQSFAAWLAKGITFELEGMSNDYIGKGISGGKIIVYPDRRSNYKSEENIIIGNTTFYGAISGEAYIRGVAGERFCIRNSGLYAVVEGVGDHGCEYMTGGRVMVLGATGRNFAAGMSGGIAYVYDEDGKFKYRCNQEMVELEKLTAEDVRTIYNLVGNHHKYTQSEVAYRILDNFSRSIYKFVKVMPKEYKRILEAGEAEEVPELEEVLDG